MKWLKEAREFTLSREVLRKKVNPMLDKTRNVLWDYFSNASEQDKFFMGPAIKEEYLKLLKEEADYFEDAFDEEYKTIKEEHKESLPEELKK